MAAPDNLDTVLGAFLRASHNMEPDELPGCVGTAAARLGAVEARILLADYEQDVLLPLCPRSEDGAAEPIDGTLVGRVYRTVEALEAPDGDTVRLLLPLLDGTDRIGVLEITLPSDAPRSKERWNAFTALVADVVITKSAYGDAAHITRRRRPMAVRAEAQRALLPPLTLMTPRLLLTGMLVPSYEVAGDLFDYALNGDVLHVAIFDAMGHSLSATLTASVAVAAYRNSRRSGGSLVDAWRAADVAVTEEFDGDRFATAVFAELDVAEGVLCSVSAGHPSALVARDNRVVARCADRPTLPLGLGGDVPAMTTTHLQAGDHLLLFTDGIVEARSPAGDFFGEERLVDGIARELQSELPPPEAIRRLVRAVVRHQEGTLRDDATLLLVEWRGGHHEGRSTAVCTDLLDESAPPSGPPASQPVR